jgi:hypothetical protein
MVMIVRRPNRPPNDIPQSNNQDIKKTWLKREPKGFKIFERSMAKQFRHWGFKPGSRVHKPNTCPNRFSHEQTS